MLEISESAMDHILTDWLKAKSPCNNIRKVLITNDLKEYKNFKQLYKEDVYSVTQNISSGPTTLRDNQARRVTNILGCLNLIVTTI